MTALAESPKPTLEKTFVADVKCYMCGTISGRVESDQQPMGRTVTFRKGGDTPDVGTVVDWRTLRCARCAGPIYLDDAAVVTRRIEHYNWMAERPRRGRPPKRLVEERRRERELLESQAA